MILLHMLHMLHKTLLAAPLEAICKNRATQNTSAVLHMLNKTMIKYEITTKDALRTVMAQVPAAETKFVDPILQMFYDDEKAGLCEITVKRVPPIVVASDFQHHVLVRYFDPEIAMLKRLSI